MHAALRPSAHDSLEDKKLVCDRLNEDGTTCGDSFIFDTAEQLRLEQLGYKNLPKSCPKYRGRKPQHNAPRVYAADKCTCSAGDACNDAKFHECKESHAGICRSGDQCKFSHSETPTGHNAAMPDDTNLKDLADDNSDNTVYSW
jgi:hypothetical protein